jgi:hypothetical protein
MSLFGQIAAGAGAVGEALNVAGTLLQSQVSIVDVDGEDTVYLNVTDSEDLDIKVNITEHPVADLGGVADYVSRNSFPLILTGIITNRNFDLRRDPVGAILSRAAAFAPQVFGAVNALASVGSKFFDLGTDEQTRKLQTLYGWQSSAKLVKVRGLKLDLQKISKSQADVFYLIEDIHPTSSPESGDGIALQITLKNMLFIDGPQSGGLQGVRGFIEKFISIPKNPFG